MQRIRTRLAQIEQRKLTAQPAALDPDALIAYARAVVTTYEQVQRLNLGYSSITPACYLICRDYLASVVTPVA